MTNTLTERTVSPYRYDIVGSFLRPQYLKEARAKFQSGEITQEELTEVEDKAIIELIGKQVNAGLKSITDGEFRRSWWHYDFYWGLNGVEKSAADEGGRQFAAMRTRDETALIVDKISGENHPFVEHFKFLLANTPEGVEARQTVPSPSRLLQYNFTNKENEEAARKVYPTDEALVQDLAKAYGQVFTDLYEAGCKTVQIDDTSWAFFVSELPEDLTTEEREKEIEKQNYMKELFLEVNNAAISHAPEELVITTHVCRGNYRSTWFTSGGYDDVATPLFDKENVDAYYLEYDSDRSGGFAPLAKVSDNKMVVLGLVTSKDGALEDRSQVIERIHEASQYIPLERLALSTQCGFASTEEGNELTEEQQWAKIALVKEVAEEVWG